MYNIVKDDMPEPPISNPDQETVKKYEEFRDVDWPINRLEGNCPECREKSGENTLIITNTKKMTKSSKYYFVCIRCKSPHTVTLINKGK